MMMMTMTTMKMKMILNSMGRFCIGQSITNVGLSSVDFRSDEDTSGDEAEDHEVEEENADDEEKSVDASKAKQIQQLSVYIIMHED